LLKHWQLPIDSLCEKLALLDKPASSGTPLFAVLLHFTQLILSQVHTYKTYAHTYSATDRATFPTCATRA